MRILDSDVCIEILRGNRQVVNVRRMIADTVVTTWITAAELFFGAAHSPRPKENRDLARRFLASLRILGLGPRSTEIFGREKSRLERDGMRIPDADLFIASIALARGAILVTGYERLYERFPDLVLENWIREDVGMVHETGAGR